MNRRKSRFWTFICSLIPGAGEMYLGFLKEGVSIMVLGCVLLACDSWLGLYPLSYGLPILWFYSFFDTHNRAGLSDEEFYALEDDYLFHFDQVFSSGWLEGKKRTVAAWVMIFLGLSIFWRPAVRWLISMTDLWFSHVFAENLSGFLYQIPRFIVAGALIIGGILLIQGKKKELNEDVEDSGNENL